MAMNKFGPVVAWLACAAPAVAAPPSRAVAPQQEREVWITIGTDALQPVRSSFQREGVALPAPTFQTEGVAVMRLSESQVLRLGQSVHEELNRCAGFIAHDSEAEAIAAAKADAAPAQNLATPTYSINNAPSVNALLAEVRELNIRNTINSLSTNWTNRYYNAQTGQDAAVWLRGQWADLAKDRPDISVAFFKHFSWKQQSVIATIQGTTHPSEIVVLGGHLDSINQSSPSAGVAPGADDDASGVSCLTEILRVAIAKGYRPARTVKFMAYAGEEVGLYGSAAIANSHKNEAANVVGVLQLDMTNYKGSAYDFGITMDRTSPALNTHVINLITTYLPTLTYTQFNCGYGCSDHASWTSAGFPASMPFEATINTDNKKIHTPEDTLTYMGGTADHSVKFAKLGAAFMAEVAKGASEGNVPPRVGPALNNTATLDATYKVPRCAEEGLSCDSGALLNGRANLGPEVTRPNTLKGACPDGTSGIFHHDESIDRIKVGTPDGTEMVAGKAVKVDVTVFTYSTADDRLDLYSAANADSPTWTFIGTLAPTSAGTSTLSTTYTLPAGGRQALRARFRYGGAAGACGTGTYDDHDDLVFAVGAAATP
ncbi:M20/M25/M40 family metallo-hydrolase [Archangium primigenium]|uniref:M20/M25/M40 family metallo-hydrolase n=1 Tax=[Archangium] primigenium TaxID=2792470 RepID=UPI0019582FE5|nr:M20/M25/M40 family metallo-hydrolase [Archangium primigenium]MBM7113457.1 M20/M25/M40 family metallo-hydrolase [Archangium primigenium]